VKTNRRSFITGGLAFGAAATSANHVFGVTDPYKRLSGSRIKVGLAAYSFRNYFRYMKGKEKKLAEDSKEIDMPGFIEYCAQHGAEGAELTSYFFPPEVNVAYLANCRKVAHLNGVSISGTAVGNNFSHPKDAPERAEQMEYVKLWIDHCAIMGAPHIRVFAGRHPKGISEDQAEKNAMGALEEAGDYAGKRGVFLGIENHDSIGTADRLLRIVKAVKSPWVGVNLDTGNFKSDTPYAEMKESAPYAVNVQLKTELKVGKKTEKADMKRIANIFKEAEYSGYVVLEFEGKENPYEHVPAILEEMNELY